MDRYTKAFYNNNNSCKMVVDSLIVLLLLFRGDEYQDHMAHVEVMAMYDFKLAHIYVKVLQMSIKDHGCINK